MSFSLRTFKWLEPYLKKSYPIDTGRKLNVDKTFRRRPGRLLNVLCTFNLRTVSKGYGRGTGFDFETGLAKAIENPLQKPKNMKDFRMVGN